MNGPSNYKFAEEIIDQAKRFMAETLAETEDDEAVDEIFAQHNAMALQALVHAVLALAAASAQNIRRNGAIDVDDCGDWTQVLRD